MKWLIPILLILFVGLQYRLWVGDGSLANVARLKREIQQQQVENDRLQERNRVLMLEVDALKSGLGSVEERAREDMGMIKEGETFFMVVEPEEDE
jgi:cell division protein FtsB